MIINALAKSRAGRIALIPVVIWCGAWSWFSYLDGTKNEQDAGRVKDWWGWLSAGMEEHWDRLSDPMHPDYGSVKHSLKNCGAEWSRLDVQRSYKALSFAIIVSVLSAVMLAALFLVMS